MEHIKNKKRQGLYESLNRCVLSCLLNVASEATADVDRQIVPSTSRSNTERSIADGTKSCTRHDQLIVLSTIVDVVGSRYQQPSGGLSTDTPALCSYGVTVWHIIN